MNNYRGPGVCSTCSHPHAEEIDHALLAKGSTIVAVARKYGLGRESLRIHKRNHAQERVRAAAKGHQATPADDILERLRVLHAETREILAEARQSKDRDGALKAITRLERQLELEGRLLGELAPAGGTMTINVLAVDDETGRRMAAIFLQRHGAPAAALPPAPIDSEVSVSDEFGDAEVAPPVGSAGSPPWPSVEAVS